MGALWDAHLVAKQAVGAVVHDHDVHAAAVWEREQYAHGHCVHWE